MSAIAFDIMGGDLAPQAAIEALKVVSEKHPTQSFIAIGTADVLSSISLPNVQCVESEMSIPMDLDAMKAIRLGSKSSIGLGIGLLSENKASAFLSAGNTAALMAISYMKLREKDGKRRPAIMSSVSIGDKKIWILDLGANIESTAQDLYENAKFAVRAISQPDAVVKLFNVGAEASKGTVGIKSAHEMLEADSELNYKGFIEGHEILGVSADIVVCNGLEGNAMTKLLESVIAYTSDSNPPLPRLAALAQLIGVSRKVYKCHGRADAAYMALALEEVVSMLSKSTV